MLGGPGFDALEELGVGQSKEPVRSDSNHGSEHLTIGSHQLIGGQIQQERPRQPVIQGFRDSSQDWSAATRATCRAR